MPYNKETEPLHEFNNFYKEIRLFHKEKANLPYKRADTYYHCKPVPLNQNNYQHNQVLFKYKNTKLFDQEVP